MDQALAASWSLREACAVLELPERRAYRWLDRRERGRLADARPGGSPMHGLLDDEVQAILALGRSTARRMLTGPGHPPRAQTE